jgi:hypothetical protein
MNHKQIENPLWAWFVLIGGGIFLLKAAPGMLITVAIPLWKPDEFSIFSIFYIKNGEDILPYSGNKRGTPYYAIL